MAIPIIMPRQGQSVETCIITKWFRQKGDQIKTGDILFSYETDKAAFDMESPADGTLLAILYEEGSEVPVLVNVAVIGSRGEDISSFLPGKPVDVTNQGIIREQPDSRESVPTAVQQEITALARVCKDQDLPKGKTDGC